MNIWIYIGIFGLLLLLGAVFFGAPYVPTRKKDAEKAVGMLERGDVLVDLGSGDGRLVRLAAEKGHKAYGIELSPILALLSKLYVWRLRRRAHIRWGNYWQVTLPNDTTVVFVFLADAYMQKLKMYLETESMRLNRPLTLISYGFELPGYTPERTERALLVYTIEP